MPPERTAPDDGASDVRSRVMDFARVMTIGLLFHGVVWLLLPLTELVTLQQSVVIQFAHGALLLVTGGLVALCTRPGTTDRFALNGARLYLIVVCATAFSSSQWLQPTVGDSVHAFGWSAILITVFPLIVRCSPRDTLVTLILVALTAPTALALLDTLGYARATQSDFLLVSYLPAVAVVLAWLVCRVTIWQAEPSRPKEVGSYELVEQLGSGGMGEVWRARHRLLARPAAIKLVHTHFEALEKPETAEQITLRFEREAQVTAALNSPHTVKLYDFGHTDDGVFYYVMEMLDGIDLDSFVKRWGPVPAPRAAAILRQVCDSLAEAHGLGLVHRDIKPANVFLCRQGVQVDFAKVLDFGLVALQSELTSGRGNEGFTGRFIGTPGFMSPELIEKSTVDERTDIYALGCLTYWLLTGRQVFDDPNLVRRAEAHVKDTPEPPSTHCEGCPPEFDALVMACLEKDPAARPASAADVARRVAGLPFARRWTSGQATRWWNTHRPAPAASSQIPAEV